MSGESGAVEQYVPQAWRFGDGPNQYYADQYAQSIARLDYDLDYDDSRFDQYRAEFLADLAAHDAEVAQDALAAARPAIEREVADERDDLAQRLSHLLCDLTNGRMSKTNYDVRTMVQEIESTFEDAWQTEREAIEREAKAEVSRLTHLLGSHADGHRCTCTMTDAGVYHGDNMHPPEWEQDPWCPTHPDVEYIKTEVAAREREAKAAALREAAELADEAGPNTVMGVYVGPWLRDRADRRQTTTTEEGNHG